LKTLANHKSALKRARQSETKRLRNKATRTRVKSVIKDVRSAAAANDGDQAIIKLNAAKSVIDKAAKKGVIHKRAAGRKVSRLSKLINSAS
jgi:small subunit ribosomal protein S20